VKHLVVVGFQAGLRSIHTTYLMEAEHRSNSNKDHITRESYCVDLLTLRDIMTATRNPVGAASRLGDVKHQPAEVLDSRMGVRLALASNGNVKACRVGEADLPAKRQKLESVPSDATLNIKYQVALRRIIELEQQADTAPKSEEVLTEDLMAARLQQMKEGTYLAKRAPEKPCIAQVASPIEASAPKQAPAADVPPKQVPATSAVKMVEGMESLPIRCVSSSTICATTNTDTSKVVPRAISAPELDEFAILSFARLIS
jgi:hypothetical protein